MKDVVKLGIRSVASAGLACAVAAVLCQRAGASVFDGIRVHEVGSYASSLAAGDFNGDGFPDIAVSRDVSSGATLRVLLSDGSGGFQVPGASYSTGMRAVEVVAAHADGDGREDLFVANTSSDRLTVLLGVGDGTFALAGSYPCGDGPMGLAVGDFNDDGVVDAVVTSRSADAIFVLLGSGGGVLGPPSEIAVGANPEAVEAGDIDNDGDDDIVVGNLDGESVSVMLSQGDGTFVAGTVVADVDRPACLLLDDLDEDGFLDLVASETGVSKISVRRGLGGGAFGPRTRYPASSTVHAMAAHDLDHDGRKDLVVGDTCLGLYFGLPGAGLGARADYDVGGTAEGVAVGDADGDGTEDLIAVANGCAAMLRGLGGGQFVRRAEYAIGPGATPRAIAAGDVDSDGDVDLVTANVNGDDLSVLLGDGNGAFEWMEPDTPAEDGPLGIVLRDLTGDGILDCVVTDEGWTIRSYVGAGDGTFAVADMCEVYTGITAPVVRDINEDGHLDVAVGYGYDPFWHNTTKGIAILLGDGEGRFERASDLSTVTYPQRLAAGDFNGDGHEDLVMLGAALSCAYLYISRGDGSFESGVPFAGELYPVAVQTVDVDCDGVLDAVLGSSSGSTIYCLFGDGQGGFGQPVATPHVGASLWDMTAGDFDCDGDIDVAVGGVVVRILRGLGNGTFGDLECYIGGEPIAAADLDGDSDLDLALLDGGDDEVVVLLGRGADTPVSETLQAAVSEEGSVLIRWSLAGLCGARWLHVERATSEGGAFERINGEPLAPLGAGSYEDHAVWPDQMFWYRLRMEMWDGSEQTVAVPPAMVRTPGVLVTRLLAPMPNPTASGVAIQMDVAADVPDARLAVYDVSGREVRVLADGPLGRGRVTVRWDGRDGCGHEAASGVYFVRLVAAEARAVCRMSVVR